MINKVINNNKTIQKPISSLWKGIFWKILSCMAFAVLNMLVRDLTGGAGLHNHHFTPAQLTFLQNITGCLFLIPWLIRTPIASMTTQNPGRHAVRIIAGVLGINLLYYAFKLMPIAQAVSLQFTGPIFTSIGAWLYLREKIGPIRIGGIVLGLIGAYIITQPLHAFASITRVDFNWHFLLPIGSAVAFAVAKLVGRDLALRGASASLLTTYLVIFMVPASALPALHGWIWPDLTQWGLIIVLGFCAWAGHFSMAKSYTYAEVTSLTPFGFSRILFSALLAYVAFGEIPTSNQFWIGSIIIMLSAVLITFSENKSNNYRQKLSS